MTTRDNILVPTDPLELEQQLLFEKARAIYRQLPNVLLFTFVATSALALYFQGVAGQSLLVWWGSMQLISLLRLGTLLHWHRSRRGQSLNPTLMIRRFAVGSLASGVVWAAFSVMYFYQASGSQRLVIALVMSAIAAGSVSVLALVPWVGRLFIAMLIGPLVVMFSTTGDMDDLVIGGLGVALFIGLTGFARVARDSALQLFVSAQDNNRKIANAVAQRDALVLDKDDLEERLAQQIETLEFEVALKERYAEELARMASTDALTGLLNRSAFEREFRALLAEAETERMPLGLMSIEVVHFDVVELQGNSVAEQVLLALSDRLKSFMPQSSLIARCGGAEFATALVSQGRIWNHEASLLRAVLQQSIDSSNGAVCVDVIIGVSSFPDMELDAGQLLYQASVARHGLRQQGIGGVKVFDPALGEGVKVRQRLRQALLGALEADELTLVFQPIEPCTDTRVRKLEALLRWNQPELGAISPAQFIPVAEESGLILPIGRWVLDTACRTASRWPENAMVSVNVSVHQILAGDLVVDVIKALAKSGLPAARLEIEITESVFSHDLEYVCAVLEQLRALGVSLAIDDFGTGYSSLAYLRRLPVDVIKIDRSFIQDFDQNARKLLLAIVSMARGLGFRIVVEGVETPQQQNLLAAMGVDYLQGYLISRPLPSLQVSAWLQEPNPLTNPGSANLGLTNRVLPSTATDSGA